jgi:hypothetical protein
MKLRIRASSMIAAAAVVCLCSLGDAVTGQRGPATRRPARPQIDYSKFSHATSKHQAACNTCHKVPTESWQKSSSYPDITDYPDHPACVSCHRAQFFRGDRPPIRRVTMRGMLFVIHRLVCNSQSIFRTTSIRTSLLKFLSLFRVLARFFSNTQR